MFGCEKRRLLLLVISFFSLNNLLANSTEFSNEDTCYHIQDHDSLKVICLIDEVTKIYKNDIERAISKGLEAKKIADEMDDIEYQQRAEGWLGYLYGSKEEYDNAIKYNKLALKHRKEIGNIKSIVNAYNNLANNYSNISQYDSSLALYSEALQLLEGVDDEEYQVTVRVNISNIYLKQGRIDDAIESIIFGYKKATELKDTSLIKSSLQKMIQIFEYSKNFDDAVARSEELISLTKASNDKMGEMQATNTLASTLITAKKYDEAIVYLKKVFVFVEEKKIPIAISTVSFNLGKCYKFLDQIDSSFYFLQKAQEINKKYNYTNKIGNVSLELGNIYFQQEDFINASKQYKKSTDIYEETSNLTALNSSYKYLAKSYFRLNNYKKSSAVFMKYIALNDSLNKEEREKQARELSAKFEAEKKALEIKNLKSQTKIDSLQRVKNERDLKVTKLEKEAQRYFFIIGSSGLALLALFFVFIAVNRKKINKKLGRQNDQIISQNEKISTQKEILQEKNKEITDSINYAFRIQSALLPNLNTFKSLIPDSFILYKPKDIVAGDFYWLTHNENSQTTYIAAADCTGHGVPGAMVSVICNNALNRSVKEFNLKAPGAILDKTKELVIKEFEKSDDEVKDGMDIALCALHTDSPSHSELHYAGANNPLWVIREGSNEVEEIKANKQPVGKFENAEPFTTNIIHLKQGDVFYLFSDGIVDQFGGEKGKKFKSKNFKSLLLSLQSLSMEAQKNEIDRVFTQWLKSQEYEYEQVDDVCVIGVRI